VNDDAIKGHGAPTPEELETKLLRPGRFGVTAAGVFTLLSVLVTAILTAELDHPGALVVEGMLLGVVWTLAVLRSAQGHLALARALVDHGHSDPALRQLKMLQKGKGRYSEEATYLVAKVYDQQGALKLALASYPQDQGAGVGVKPADACT
jgi:hypothetical protein